MRNIKLIITYDGSNYLGWQKTNAGPSIEESLEKALFQVLQQPVVLQAASRTDAGVHALGQVVNFQLQNDDIDLKRLGKSVNSLLGKEISILSIEEVEESFHPTLDNEGKEYLYTICNVPTQLPFNKNTSWHFPYKLNLEVMREAAALIEGYKDFSAFCNERSQFTRDPFCLIEKISIYQLDEMRLCISIKGSRFLYKMARNIVGTLAYIGSGKISLSELEGIIQNRQRIKAGVTAPAHGLMLSQVFYPSLKKTEEFANT